MTNRNEFCFSCGQSLGLEIAIQDILQGDGHIDYCLECQTRALNTLLENWIAKVPDTLIRSQLRNKLISTINSTEITNN